MPRPNRPRRPNTSTIPLEVRACLYCGANFMPNRGWQKYCSPVHSRAASIVRKYGTAEDRAATPAADAPPITLGKLEEFQDIDINPAEKTIETPTSITPSHSEQTEKFFNKKYGIPELDEEKDK